MRTRWLGLPMMVLLVVVGVVGCAAEENQVEPVANAAVEVAELSTGEPAALPTEAPTAVPEPTVDPAVAVVQEHVALVNAEDYAGAAELLADDMMAYFLGMPPTGMEIYWGREQYQAFLEACCTGQHFEMEVVPERSANGMVWAETKTWMDFTRELGVAPNSFHEIYRVEDGLITLYVSSMTEEALAKNRPVWGEVMPELFMALEPPDVSGVTPATEMTVTIENGTCTFDSPPALQAGQFIVHADVVDEQFDKYAVSFFTLDEDKDLLDLMASTAGDQQGPPSWAEIVFWKEPVMNSGQTQTYEDFMVEEGLLYLVCWAEPQGMPIGNGGPFVVVP